MSNIADEIDFRNSLTFFDYADNNQTAVVNDDSRNLSTTIDSASTSTPECLAFQKATLTENLFFGIALPVFYLVGIIANCLNLMVFTDRRHMPAPTYIYLCVVSVVHSVALANQGVHLVLLHFFYDNRLIGQSTCYLFWPLSAYTSSLSTCLYVATTVERYCYVRTMAPQSPARMARRQRHTRIAIFFIFLIILVANFPKMVAYNYNYERNCYETRWATGVTSWFSLYSFARIATLNIGMLAATVLFQTLLVGILLRKMDSTKHQIATNKSAHSVERKSVALKRERTLTIALVALVLFCVVIEILVLLFNPLAVTLFWMKVSRLLEENRRMRSILIKSVMPLASIEYSISFFFNLAFNATFRRRLGLKLRASFCCCGTAVGGGDMLNDGDQSSPIGISTNNNRQPAAAPGDSFFNGAEISVADEEDDDDDKAEDEEDDDVDNNNNREAESLPTITSL